MVRFQEAVSSPIHVDDVALGLVNLTKTDNLPKVINFTGEKALTLAEYLSGLRVKFYHKNSPVIVNIPMPIAKFFASILQPFSKMISVDSLILLENGNVADNANFLRLLNRDFTQILP